MELPDVITECKIITRLLLENESYATDISAAARWALQYALLSCRTHDITLHVDYLPPWTGTLAKPEAVNSGWQSQQTGV